MIDALFGSKTRVKLLSLFLNNPEKSFYVREITRKIDEQINSVRRELSNMQEIGIVNSQESNNKVYYSVDKDNMFFEPLRQIFSLEIKVPKKDKKEENVWVKRFSDVGDIKLVIFAGKLIGDLGRGDSNIDLLVVGNTSDARMKNLVKNIEKEEKIASNALNYAKMSYLDFYRRLNVKDPFINSIIVSKHSIIIDNENLLITKEQGKDGD